MKFIVENYSDATTTQPLYFHHVLQNSSEHTSVLYEPKTISVYDILDRHNPDYYITHISLLTQDFVAYSNNENTSIRLLLNVSSLSSNDIIDLDIQLKNDKVNCPIFFTNIDQKKLPKLKNRRILTLSDAADNNLFVANASIKYSMNKAYFLADNFDPQDNSPHHIITTNSKLSKNADIVLPEAKLATIYKYYDEVIFCGLNNHIPQSFFDCLLSGCKVYYLNQNQDMVDLIQAVLKPEFSLDYTNKDRMTDFSALQKYVQEKHAGQNRVKMLLSQLPGA